MFGLHSHITERLKIQVMCGDEPNAHPLVYFTARNEDGKPTSNVIENPVPA